MSQKPALRFTESVRSRFSSESSSIDKTGYTPALCTTMSSRPKCSTVCATTRFTSLWRPTSVWLSQATPPSFTMESATDRPFARLRVAMTTLAPALAKTRAIPSPMPWPAPVTIATLPDRSTFMTNPPQYDSRGPQPRRPEPHELRNHRADRRDGDLQRAHFELVAGHHDRKRQEQCDDCNR